MSAVRQERRRSQRRAGEQERLEAGRMAEMAGALAGVGYWRLDLQTGQSIWSDLMYEIYGRSPDEPPPSLEESLAVHFPHNAEDVRRGVQKVVAGGATGGALTFELTRLDGEVRLVSGQSTLEFDAAGRPVAMFGTLMDVTEQRRAEAAVRESEALYRLLAENATDLIARVGLEGETLYVTPSLEKVTGWRAADMIGRKTLEFVHRDDGARLVAGYRRVMEGGPSERIEYRFRHRDGRWIWLEANPSLLRDEHGRPREFIDVARDITARKALEEALVAARQAAEAAAEAKAQFLANMSHELRTPITAVLGFTELLAARTDLDETARRCVDRIASGGRALLATINDVLDFSKLEAGQLAIKPEPMQPRVLVAEALELFEAQAQAKGLALRTEGLESLPACALADADRLRQVLLNLIGNAVKFTDAGAVVVSARWDPAVREARLSVSDTGPGIAPERAARLFQRFSQLEGEGAPQRSGTGLGLAICKGLVEAMGGRIGLESAPAAGACFWFTLPMAPTQMPAAEQAGASEAPVRGVRVLVADDHPANRELARAILEPLGCAVMEAADGAQAVELAGLHRFDMILMDLRMPLRDGREAVRAIRGGAGPNAGARMVAFTADGDADPRTGDAALFDDRLGKPLRAADLVAAVAAAALPASPSPRAARA